MTKAISISSPIRKIISGGQTGVDRAALDWAMANSIAHGGWCPKGRKAEDGVIPKRYQLRQTRTGNYPVRTRRNVRDSDATVIFSTTRRLTGGSLETARFAKELGKPLLHLIRSAGVNAAAKRLNRFVHQHSVTTLNVAGPRASAEHDIGKFVKAVLSLFLERL